MKEYKVIKTSIAEKTSWKMTTTMRPENMVAMSSLASATQLDKIRSHYIEKGKSPPSYTSMIIKAAALTMKKHPEANRAILGLPFFKKVYEFDNLDISVAVEKSLPALPGQPYAATIERPVNKNLDSINNELKHLVSCTEENEPKLKQFMFILKKIPAPFSLLLINSVYWFPRLWIKYRGCAAWVNSPAKAGTDLVVTCWPWPITFSFGIVKKRPIVIDDSVQVGLTIPLLLSFDRRIMGGAPASRVFATFVEIIESAEIYLERVR